VTTLHKPCVMGSNRLEEASGRIVDFRILPLSLLGRPRVDLLLAMSGLFRDSFERQCGFWPRFRKRLAEQEESPDLTR